MPQDKFGNGFIKKKLRTLIKFDDFSILYI